MIPMTNLTLLHANKDEETIDGWHFPAGTQVGLLHSAMNMSKDRWEEPEKFKPERFLNANGQFVNTDKVVFYGLGKRRCVGEVLGRAELYLFFGTVYQHFRFKPAQGFKPSSWDDPAPGIIFYPQEFDAIIEPRN